MNSVLFFSLSLYCALEIFYISPNGGGVTIETVVVAAAAAASVNAVVKEKMCCKRRAGDVCVCHLAMV
jgi:hypothetical protein